MVAAKIEMRTKTSITLLAAMAGVLPVRAENPDRTAVAEAGTKFRQNCLGCHQPPDLRFATDRAWLGQIRETA